MASKLIVLLTLALLSYAHAAPATTEQLAETTPAADEDVAVLTIIKVIEEIPVLVAVDDGTTTPVSETKEPAHKVAKRSALRGDNPNNDLLANSDGFAFDNAELGVGGRRIKFLPSWAG